ncbi:ornithine carbamoyltransferase [Candidatus Bathycorpusculum sp.]|jgi:ornithine carbamoyltransferase|uniref:ornithine carbamoyltransferase n=1 Tax=Candidatus Bathycorpusculum sp. TaxID=2994959 RepID=UPI00282B3335|nr:ornithine carbamoyltransferase [Candidatus Termitimicrobium sp.]MCL2686173.1 ornithine carbamoyltransferase [Candidatus Termitimicrobium sp.]
MHLINFKGLTGQELEAFVDLAIETKQNSAKFLKVLEGRSTALIFQKTSTRTRVSFEVAMTQLGGHALFIDWKSTNFTLADIGDEIEFLSRNVDCIMARLLFNSDLQKMTAVSRVPIVNGCDEKYHPSQVLADLVTIKEKRGKLAGTKLVYIGVHNNVTNSLIEASSKTGIKLTTVTPLFNEAARDEDLLLEAKKTGLWEESLDVKKAVAEADFVYTDTWIDMEFFTDPKFEAEKEKRIKLMMPYQINAELLRRSEAAIMHDMPIHRGYEISTEVINSPKSVIYQQAENRLYAAKAIYLKLMSTGSV